jgi:hypothetical protein
MSALPGHPIAPIPDTDGTDRLKDNPAGRQSARGSPSGRGLAIHPHPSRLGHHQCQQMMTPRQTYISRGRRVRVPSATTTEPSPALSAGVCRNQTASSLVDAAGRRSGPGDDTLRESSENFSGRCNGYARVADIQIAPCWRLTPRPDVSTGLLNLSAGCFDSEHADQPHHRRITQ